MIGKLKGIVEEAGKDEITVDVSGIGYEVHVSARLMQNIKIGDNIILVIHTHVREDMIKLYGFSSRSERTWFRTLQNVQGVGARVALAILGVLSPNDLANVVTFGDCALVEQAPGVGKKLAQRIVSELKDKVPPLETGAIGTNNGHPPSHDIQKKTGEVTTHVPDAVSALINLGYQPAHASRAVAIACKKVGTSTDTPELIRRSLQELS